MRQVVVVGPDPGQLQELTSRLQVMGLDARSFARAEDALEAMSQGAPPDLVITDLYMPGIDGWRLCRLLRSPEFASLGEVPILVVSSTYAGEHPQAIAADVGAAAFLAAPVDAGVLEEQVGLLLDGRSVQPVSTVLIVEDSRTVARFLQREFEGRGYRVRLAHTGEEARRLFAATAPEMAVLDYHLPDTTGECLLVELRQRRPATVVVMMTGDPSPELAMRFMSLGAAAYARKPFRPDYLVALCERARRERTLLYGQDLLETRTRALREAELRFRTLFEGIPDAVIVHDEGGAILHCNDAVTGLLGRPQEELLGRGLDEITEPPTTPPATGDAGECAVYVDRAGRRLPCEVRRSAITWQGRPATLLVIRDVSERTRAQEALRRAEQRYRLFLDSFVGIAYQMQTDERAPAFFHGTVKDITGYDAGDFLSGKARWPDLVHPEDRDGFWQEAARLATNPDYAIKQVYRIVDREGRVRWVSDLCRVTPDAAPGPRLLQGAVYDVTEQVKTERALESGRKRLQSVMDAMADGVYIVNGEHYIEYANPTIVRDFGPFEGKRCYEYFAGGQSPCPWCRGVPTAEGQSHLWEWRSTRTGRTYDLFHTPLRDEDGGISMLGVMHDITEREQAEAALKRELDVSRAIAELSSVLLDPASTVEQVSRTVLEKACALTGSRAGFVATVQRDPTGTGDGGLRRWAACLQGAHDGEAWHGDSFMVGHEAEPLSGVARYSNVPSDTDGLGPLPTGHLPVECWLSVPMVVGGQVLGQIALANAECGYGDRDLEVVRRLAEPFAVFLQRHRAEQALLMSEEFNKTIISSASEGIVVCDRQLRYLVWNRFMEELTGLAADRVLGRRVDDEEPCIEADGLGELLRRALAGETATSPDTHFHIPATGKSGWVSCTYAPQRGPDGAIVGVVTAVRDVSERRRLEAQLIQAQKMESVGRLAGGIAHDFNNLLTAITGYASFAAEALTPDDPLQRDIDQVLRTAERAAQLTRQLLAFSRRQVITLRAVDLSTVVLDVDRMLRRLIGEDVELVTIPAAGPVMARADAGQVGQVLLNLAINARDAMPQGGTLSIETAAVSLDEAQARRHPDVGPGDYVVLSVTDTGTGMSDEVKQHLFEPFFTTKEAGRGTGLGLATVYGIVRQHGGGIEVESELGKGSVFRVYLPRVSQAEAEPDCGDRSAAGPAGSETVLVVEDEPHVRRFLTRVLREQGYEVLEAGTGNEALRLVETEEARVHLLLTDMVMPQMSGRELADRMRRRCHRLPVLYVSGYTDETADSGREGILGEGSAFLQKPFTATALSAKVRRVLDGC